MSIFSVPLTMASLHGTEFRELNALVDTGSTFTSAPRQVLDALGVRPVRKERFALA